MKVQIATLEPVKYAPKLMSKAELIEDYSDITSDYKKREKVQKLSHVFDNINGSHFHPNYMTYLETAWGHHYGIVMTPDILWHSLLSEAVLIVGENPKKYAHLFTTTPDEKQPIIVPSDSLTIMPLDTLIEAIKKKVPTDTGIFLPEFTTTTDSARMARYAAFADLVSPFYSYMMYMCGIPYVDVRGTKEDYEKIATNWALIGQQLVDNDEYFEKTFGILNRVANEMDNPDFWANIFTLEKCGSGSQTEVFGWWSELYRKQPSIKFAHNFSSHVAKVSYKQLNTQKDFEMYQGVLHSTLNGDCLEPDFGCMVYEKLKEPLIKPLY